MSNSVKQKDGRTWKVTNKGIKTLSRDYVIVLDSVTSSDGEWTSMAGLPSVGSRHPAFNYLYVTGYDVKEGSGKDKQTVVVTVNYDRQDIEAHEDPDTHETVIDSSVESWGWDSSTATKELTEDFSNPKKKVVNSAGDPFDRVPTVEGFAPVFTKVFKSPTRISGAQAISCHVNSSAVTIGGLSCAARTLLCAVGEEAIIGDTTWKYRYRIQLKYRPETWDVKLIQSGMRCRDPQDPDNKIICTVTDPETGRTCRVTSSAPLDNSGYQVSPTDPEGVYEATFKAYPEASIPGIFTSEPTLEEPDDDED